MLIKTRKNARKEVLHSLRLGATRDSAIALFHRIRRLEMFKHIPIPTCRIPEDHMAACETGAGASDTTLSLPA